MLPHSRETPDLASRRSRDRPPRRPPMGMALPVPPQTVPPVAETLRSFLDRYADAYAALDAETLATMYTMPCFFVGSGQTASFDTPQALLRHLGFVAEMRREQSIGSAVPTRVQTLADGGAQTAVLVHWIIERAEQTPLRFRSLYHLVQNDGRWHIAVSASLDE